MKEKRRRTRTTGSSSVFARIRTMVDEEELVAIIEQPDGSMVDTPVRVARNGGAGPVRSNAEGPKSASAPDHRRAGKFKKQQRAPPKYQRPNQ